MPPIESVSQNASIDTLLIGCMDIILIIIVSSRLILFMYSVSMRTVGIYGDTVFDAAGIDKIWSPSALITD